MKQTGNTIIDLLKIILLIFVIISWPTNLYRLTQCDFQSPVKCELFHTLGILPIIAPFTVWFSTDTE